MTLAILVTWHAVRHPWLFLVVGMLLGLSFDSKYTGSFALLPIGAYLAYYYAFRAHQRPPKHVWLLPVAALLTIYIADPAIWVSPIDRLVDGIVFQWDHAARGHSVFLNGLVWDHVPPGEVVFILVAKMSLFICIPALLALPWALTRIIRAKGHPSGRDERAAFVFFWLFGMLLPFGLLNIVVGTHYMLPLAPAITFIGAWALAGRVSLDWPSPGRLGRTWFGGASPSYARDCYATISISAALGRCDAQILHPAADTPAWGAGIDPRGVCGDDCSAAYRLAGRLAG